MAYKSIVIEICGKCNAKCRWCITGIQNRLHPDTMPAMKKAVMPLELFKQVVEHLMKEGIADKDTSFGLYNWGEPFLHPDLLGILSYLYKNKLHFSLSTNGSIPFKAPADLPKDFFALMDMIIFSFCGFTQDSYDLIHGFNVEAIKKNVACMCDTIRAHGGHSLVAQYHTYQFNQGEEMDKALAFFAEHGIGASIVYAFFNDYGRAIGYLTNTLPYEELKRVSGWGGVD